MLFRSISFATLHPGLVSRHGRTETGCYTTQETIHSGFRRLMARQRPCSNQTPQYMDIHQMWITTMHSNDNDLHVCRICGWPQQEPPWGNDGKTPTFDICDCCGVEFGYEDSGPDAVRRYRKQWMDHGCSWFSPKSRPQDWVLDEYLEHVPSNYR